MGLIKDGFRFYRAYNKESRMFKKSLFKSTTTQNVAMGAVTGQTVAMGLIAGIRTTFPDLLWWEPDMDTAVVQVLSVILIPLLSRFIASIRKGGKNEN